MLVLRNITKDYASGDTRVEALRGIDLEFGGSEFAAVLGLWLGVQGTVTAVFLAVLAGGVAALLLLLEGRGKDSEIAFGPFLAMGAYVSYLWGSSLWQLYWGLLL